MVLFRSPLEKDRAGANIKSMTFSTAGRNGSECDLRTDHILLHQIRTARTATGISRRALAERLGVDVQSIKRMEQAIARYIDGFYNPIRRHSALNYISPAQFERTASR